MKKYELTSKCISGHFGHRLHRIRACRDFVTVNGYEVKAGDLGGWVETEDNLSQEGLCWIGGEAEVYCGSVVRDNAVVHDYACIDLFAKIYGNAIVGGLAKIDSMAKIHGNAIIGGSAKIGGAVEICGDTEICGKVRIFEPVHFLNPNYKRIEM